MFASRTLQEGDPTFIANVQRDGIILFSGGILPEVCPKVVEQYGIMVEYLKEELERLGSASCFYSKNSRKEIYSGFLPTPFTRLSVQLATREVMHWWLY